VQTNPTQQWKRVGPVGMVLRGLTRRCARCGSGRLFTNWFSMKERCPRCDLKFEREEGFFLGAYTMNMGFVLIGCALVIAIGFGVKSPDGSIIPMMIAGLGVTVLLPPLAYPISKTLWVAIDMIMVKTLGTDRRVPTQR
jgi:hypothetical protein